MSGSQEGGGPSGAERRRLTAASNLAEHRGLRLRAELLADFDAAGLIIIGKINVRPSHPHTSDQADPLRTARAAEMTALWWLGIR